MKTNKNRFWNTLWVSLIIIAAITCASLFKSAMVPAFVERPSEDFRDYQKDNAPYHLLLKECVLSEIGLSFHRPMTWTETIRNGNTAFINPNDGGLLTVEILEYDPAFNIVDADKAELDIYRAGGTPLSFQAFLHGYLVEYALEDLIYWEFVQWDLSTVIRLTGIYPAELYEEYSDIFTHIYGSVQWERPDPAPEGYLLCYDEQGNIEFLSPIGWTYILNESGNYQYTDQETMACISISIIISDATFHDTTDLEYADFLGASRTGFILRDYSNNGTELYGEAVYSNGTEQNLLMEYRIATGRCQYVFSMDVLLTNSSTGIEAFRQLLEHIRLY